MQIQSELIEVSIDQLRPTQMTVGYREVERKRDEWKRMDALDCEHAMSEQFFPTVKGPAGAYYIIDHHHTALAIRRAGAKTVKVGVITNLDCLSMEDFWIFLDHRTWVHCYDTKGERKPFASMPKTLREMADDPYRSLATAVRRKGGFAKSDLPYLEFLWANFFRKKIAPSLLQKRMKEATRKAIKLAGSKDASHLPGWAGST